MTQPQLTNRLSSPRTHIILLTLLWLLTHSWTLTWNLPNIADGISPAFAVRTGQSAKSVMRASGHRHPPLQYLIWDALVPGVDTGAADQPGMSRRILMHRLISALFALATAILLYGITAKWLDNRGYCVLAAALYILNPFSLSVSHTVTGHTATAFWLVAAWYLCLRLPKDKRPDWRLPLAIGACFAGAICSTDSAWAFLLPLPIAAGWRLGRSPDKTHVACLAAMLGSFALVTIAVYLLAGGIGIRHDHLNTVLNSAPPFAAIISAAVAKFPGAIGTTLCALDWPILAGLALCVLCKPSVLLNPVVWRTTTLGVVAFALLHVLDGFIVRAHDGQDRLPLIALAAVVCVNALDELNRRHAPFARLAVFMAVAVAAIGMNTAWRLKYDARWYARNVVEALQNEQTEPAVVAVAGAEIPLPKPADGSAIDVVDNSWWQYGQLANRQFTIALNHLYMSLTLPDIVVMTEPSASRNMLMLRYGLARHSIVGDGRRFFTLYRPHSPTYFIYVKIPSRKAEPWFRPTLRFEEQLLVFQSCINMGVPDLERRFGALCRDFSPPDLEHYAITNATLRQLIAVYKAAARPGPADAVMNYLANPRANAQGTPSEVKR